MASEGDGARKLAPIHDALSIKNYKRAIKLATALEAKKKTWIAPRALKACALLKLSRLEEAGAIMADIKHQTAKGTMKMSHLDANKVQMYYIQTRELSKAALALLDAWTNEPDNVALGEEVFVAQLCSGEYETAHRTATKLQRLCPSWPSYMYWGIVMNFLQVKYSAADKRLLLLAAALAKKRMHSGNVNSAEIARFILRLLCESNEANEAKAALEEDGIFADRFPVPTERLTELATVCVDTGDTTRAKEIYRTLIEDYVDEDWSIWKQFIQLSVQKGQDESAEECRDFIDRIWMKQKERQGNNGAALLAKLELERRCRDVLDESDVSSAKLPELFIDYFDAMSRKPICARNIWMFSDLLSEAQKLNVSTALVEIAEGRDLASKINLSKVQQSLGTLDSSAEDLVATYKSILDVGGGDGVQIDEFLLLSAKQKLRTDLNCHENDLVETSVLLEKGIEHSSSVAQFKLLLILIYNKLCASSLSYALWVSMDIKYIQLLSLSYMILDDLISGAQYNIASRIVESILSFAIDAERDSCDGMHRALRAESITTVVDFVSFRLRLRDSKTIFKAELYRGFLALAEITSKTAQLDFYKSTVSSAVDKRIFTKTIEDLTNDDDLDVTKFWNNSSTGTRTPLAAAEVHRLRMKQLRLEILVCLAEGGESGDFPEESFASLRREGEALEAEHEKIVHQLYVALLQMIQSAWVKAVSGSAEEATMIIEHASTLENSILERLDWVEKACEGYAQGETVVELCSIITTMSFIAFEFFPAAHFIFLSCRKRVASRTKSKKLAPAILDKWKSADAKVDALGSKLANGCKRVAVSCEQLESRSRIVAENLPKSIFSPFLTSEDSDQGAVKAANSFNNFFLGKVSEVDRSRKDTTRLLREKFIDLSKIFRAI